MRSVSGARNRVVLALTGLLSALAGTWLVASNLDASRHWPEVDHLVAEPGVQLGSLAQQHWTWLLPVSGALAVLLLLAGLWLLLRQLPRRARTAPLRLTGPDRSLLASVDTAVLERALAERAQELPGVSDCTVWVAGSARELWLQVTATVSPDAEVALTVAGLRQRLAEDATTALGSAPQQVDLVVRPNRRTVSEAATGRRSPRGAGRRPGRRLDTVPAQPEGALA